MCISCLKNNVKKTVWHFRNGMLVLCCILLLWMLPNIALLDKHLIFVKKEMIYNPTIYQKRNGFQFWIQFVSVCLGSLQSCFVTMFTVNSAIQCESVRPSALITNNQIASDFNDQHNYRSNDYMPTYYGLKEFFCSFKTTHKATETSHFSRLWSSISAIKLAVNQWRIFLSTDWCLFNQHILHFTFYLFFFIIVLSSYKLCLQY